MSLQVPDFSHFPSNAVVLLEGTRGISLERAGELTQMARELADAYPDIMFRSGNASGSDEAFSSGIWEEYPDRIQLVLPYKGHRKTKRPAAVTTYSLDDLSSDELKKLVDVSCEASAQNRKGFHNYLSGNLPPRPRASIALLLRDALKIVGAQSIGVKPADHAIFQTNPENPMGGGTGHTVRICDKAGVPMSILS